MKVHHIGYLVKAIAPAADEFIKLGYTADSDITLDETRNIYIQFLKNGEYLIELVAPANAAAPVNNLIKKCGSTPYHVCYISDTIHADIEQLKKGGYIVIEEPSPAPAIANKSVVFLFKEAVGIIEIVES